MSAKRRKYKFNVIDYLWYMGKDSWRVPLSRWPSPFEAVANPPQKQTDKQECKQSRCNEQTIFRVCLRPLEMLFRLTVDSLIYVSHAAHHGKNLSLHVFNMPVLVKFFSGEGSKRFVALPIQECFIKVFVFNESHCRRSNAGKYIIYRPSS